MGTVPVELHLPDSPQESFFSRFSNLRGIQWRINLGILPSSSSASIEELRRVAADCRRRYASLRRRLLIDPHIPKDGSKSPDHTMDNPLSENPDSTWGRFFRNAELEKLVDKDLSRLYPEVENYFQTPTCQALLRRILLVWCLRHPEYGYRQGMHELLAPLLYVLHVDIQHLSQVRSLYEDCFSDEFDEMNFSEGDQAPNKYTFKKSSSCNSRTDDDDFEEEGNTKITTLDDLDPETKELFLLSDAYGAEGELGVILSDRFMEHDAYCMFDGLMSGARGVVAMADFFSPSPAIGSSTSLPPVIEASAALYHLLSIVDSSLHTHLIELGVEPQYFALRWLRVLFGREFSLDNLLLIWDEIFSSSNVSCVQNELECSFKILCSPRGAFIAAMAVSMLLHLRSSLLATGNATSCLQRLLNFPRNVHVQKLIEKAKSWQALALEANISSCLPQNSFKLGVGRIQSIPNKAGLPQTPSQTLPESYWEEKWRVLHKGLSSQKNGGDPISRGKIKKLLGNRFGLARTQSDPCPAKKDSRSSTVKRSLLDDLNDVNNNLVSNRDADVVNGNESLPLETGGEKSLLKEPTDQSIMEDTCLSEGNSSLFSTANSPHCVENDNDNDSEKSTVSSNSFVVGNDEEANQVEEIEDAVSTTSGTSNENSTNTDEVANRVEEIEDAVSTTSGTSNENSINTDEVANRVEEIEDAVSTSGANSKNNINTGGSKNEVGPSKDGDTKRGVGLKDWKLLSGKFLWFLRLGRGSSEGNSEKETSNGENVCKQISASSYCDDISCGDSERIEVGEKKVMDALQNLGQSMLENIQVIESVFQQDRGKGQATAMAALKELRKISNLLSDM